jgi:hypothetical protein
VKPAAISKKKFHAVVADVVVIVDDMATVKA